MLQLRRTATRLFAVLFGAGALWRGFVAGTHYRLSLEAVDDPSLRELEQVNAAFEGGIALLLLAHAAAALVLARRPFQFRWPLALAAALASALVLGGSLGGLPLLSLPGVYPAAIVLSLAVLARFLAFDWLSLYLGALVGSLLGCYAATRVADLYVLLFVAAPCLILAFLGAGLGRLLLRVTERRERPS